MKWLSIGILLILLLSGCKDREVTKLIDKDQELIYSSTETVQEPRPTEVAESTAVIPTKMNEIPSNNSETPGQAINGEEGIVPDTQETGDYPNSKSAVIIAKSEGLENLDEKTLILNEIDDLLDSTLSSLDAIEDDALTNDNIINEGGVE